MYFLKKKRPNRSASVKTKKKKFPVNLNLKPDLNSDDNSQDKPEEAIIPDYKHIHFKINSKDFLQHQITINTTDFPKILDLKTKIASKIITDPINIEINDYKPEYELKKIPDNLTFNISILNPTKDIKFCLLKDQTITIINGSAMNLDQILSQFQKHDYYFSPKSVNDNLNFFLGEFKIPKDNFDLSFIPPDAVISVNLDENAIKFKIKNKNIFFSDGESMTSSKMINEIFNLSDRFVIKFIPKEINSITKATFVKSIEYKIYILYQFEFIYLKNNQKYRKTIEFNSNIFDIKKLFCDLFCDNGELKIENIIIYDEKKNIINDLNRKLKSLKIIYFDINYADSKSISFKPTQTKNKDLIRNKKTEDLRIEKLKINFFLDRSSDIYLKPFTKEIEISTKIKDIEKNIIDTFDIKDKIIFYYQNKNDKIIIDSEMTIKDIKDKIIPQCKLYIKIEKEPNTFNFYYSPIASPKAIKKNSILNKFKYEEIIKEIEFDENSLLIDNIKKIKEIFEINQKEKIILIICKNNKENKIQNLNQKMIQFENQIIHIYLENTFNNTMIRLKSPKVTINKYFYQMNNYDSIKEIELDSDANIRTFKRAIARINHVNCLSNIKILLNGRNLENDEKIVNVYDNDEFGSIFYVYIRTDDDIFLMTSKNIHINLKKAEVDSDDDDDEVDDQNQFCYKSDDFSILDSKIVENFMKIAKFKFRGNKSKIYKVKQIKGEESIAIKVLDLQVNGCSKGNFIKFKKFIQEYEIIVRLNHPNIIKAFGIYYGDEKQKPCILLEYFEYNLGQLIHSLTKSELIEIIYQISDAMKNVHKQGIFHRDLKPSNILIDEHKHAKICDFGISALFSVDDECNHSNDSNKYTKNVGSVGFMAPEMLDDNYTEKVDVYSFGAIVLFIVTNGKSKNKIMSQVPSIPSYVNNFSRSLIMSCMSFSPDYRPSFEEITNLIVENKFNFFDGIDIDLSLIYEHLGIK